MARRPAAPKGVYREPRKPQSLTSPRFYLRPVPSVQPGRLLPGVPSAESQRQHFGRALDLARIDSAIRHANMGFMRTLTDMARETVSIDGHLSSVLGKRLNRVAALEWEVQAASGPDIDRAFAQELADFVRTALERIPQFRQRLLDLAWGVFDGRAASELEWYVGPRGRLLVRDIHWLHPRRLSFGPDRELRVIPTDADAGDFRAVGYALDSAPGKFLQYRPRLFGDYPEREGLAPRCLYWSFFQRFGTRERLVLLELFGKPWRIIEATEQGPWNAEAAQDALDQIDALGGNSTARLPPGYKVQIAQPAQGAGDVHAEAITDAREVISKLVLGNTGTTDAVPTGLGSSIGDNHLSEQDLVIAGDAWRLAEVIEDQLTDVLVSVNYGVAALEHAPRFKIRTDPPVDRSKEGERVQRALDIGLVLSAEEVYQRTGFRQPSPEEARLRKVARDGAVPAPEIVFVSDMPTVGTLAPFPAEPIMEATGDDSAVVSNAPVLQITPSDIARIATVNEARASQGLPPLTLQDGTPDPDGKLSVAEYAAKREALAQARAAGVEAQAVADATAAPEPPAPAPGAAPPPPATAAALAEEDDASDVALLAEKMTQHGLERCEHQCRNRCRICGIERVRDFEMGADGAPVWAVRWRAIGAAKAPQPPAPPEPPDEAAPESEPPDQGAGEPEQVLLSLALAEHGEHDDATGAHSHALDRATGSVEAGGEHSHAFDIDGMIVWTEDGDAAIRGWHQHEAFDAAQTFEHKVHGGEHLHTVAFLGGTLRTEVGGYHAHEAGVTSTGHDGAHTHTLVLPDGRVFNSLDAAALAALVPAGNALGLALDGVSMDPEEAALRQEFRDAGLPFDARRALARQPETANGSPERMVDRGVNAGAIATAAWVRAVSAAVDGLDDADAIRGRLNAMATRLPLATFTALTEREVMHSAMLGALDAHAELTGTIDKAGPVAFAGEGSGAAGAAGAAGGAALPTVPLQPGFSGKPYREALQWFRAKDVLTRKEFDALGKAAKQRAFTVAKLTRKRLLQDAKAALARAVERGTDLRTFSRFVARSLEASGWTPANPSHVQTIFRTNVVSAYSAGRHKQMSGAVAVKLRPNWQILTVNDGPPRQRPTHQAAHGTVLPHDHPFWKQAFPPFGYNCRCRVRAVSAATRVTSPPKGLPDEGFASGTAGLL